MSGRAWQRASFEIAQTGCTLKVVVSGYVRGPFGVFRDASHERYPWSVTHLTTGWSLGFYERRSQAQTYAEAITPLCGWDLVTTSERRRVAEIVRPAYETTPGHQPLEPAP